MENAPARMVRSKDTVRYSIRRTLRSGVTVQPAPHTRFLTVPWLVHDPLQQGRRQPRLADPRLAREEHDLPIARLCLGPAAQQELALFLAPDQGGQPTRVQRLEP